MSPPPRASSMSLPSFWSALGLCPPPITLRSMLQEVFFYINLIDCQFIYLSFIVYREGRGFVINNLSHVNTNSCIMFFTIAETPAMKCISKPHSPRSRSERVAPHRAFVFPVFLSSLKPVPLSYVYYTLLLFKQVHQSPCHIHPHTLLLHRCTSQPIRMIPQQTRSVCSLCILLLLDYHI